MEIVSILKDFLVNSADVFFVVLTPGWDAVKVHACNGQYGFALLTPSLLVENMLAAALVYFVVVRCRKYLEKHKIHKLNSETSEKYIA